MTAGTICSDFETQENKVCHCFYCSPIHFIYLPWSTNCTNCCFLTCIQVCQEAGKVVWYFHLFKSFPQFVVIHTVKDFSVVNKAEVDDFLEFACFFYDPTDVGNLISGSPAFSKSSLYIWKFSVHVLLKPSLQNFEHYFASMRNECNCVVVWTVFGITLLWIAQSLIQFSADGWGSVSSL